MNRYGKILFGWAPAVILILGGPALAAEPIMTDYTSYPIFMSQSVKPNILIILDNSGSMNFNAYGTWPGNGGLVSDGPYTGEPYCGVFETRVADVRDDAEERSTDNGAYYNSGDLDLGRYDGSNEVIAGIRFQDVRIPAGATVTNAYLEFTVDSAATGEPISLIIYGEDAVNAPRYNGTFGSFAYHDISGRDYTSTSVLWNSASSPVLSQWTHVNDTYRTPDLSAIVQEIIQGGWAEGNAMAFMIQYQTPGSSNSRPATAYDNNHAEAPLLHIEYTPATCSRYYGYFNPDWFYDYSSNKFHLKYRKIAYDSVACPSSWEVEDTGGGTQCLNDASIVSQALWDGNWMNWASMRRIDVARKVLMGGLATSRTGGGNQVNYGETPNQSYRTFVKRFDSSPLSAVSPYDGDYYYGMSGGYMYVDNDPNPFSGQIQRLTLAIQKDENYEPEDFFEGNLAGVLQRVGDQANWGNMFFYNGTGANQEGGYLSNRIGMNMTTIITDLQNTGADTWTPLAETLYVGMQYFKQEDPDDFNGTGQNLGYHNNAAGSFNNTFDPFYNGSEFVPCVKNFVILITDGASTKDNHIPDLLKDYDGDGSDPGTYGSNGSDYLDDVALYAHTTDLRDLDGDQNITLYTIYAFGNEANARQLLKDAARNGGFVDRDGDNLPDGDYGDVPADRLEWDANGDGDPDTYFEATDGYIMQSKLLDAITDILRRAAAGTAVSVLATSTEGEGNLVQAYFKPVVTTGTEETKWVGYVQSLWVDGLGFMREDTNSNLALDLDEDKVITYFIADDGDTRLKRFSVDEDNPYPDVDNDSFENLGMDEINPLWEAGSVLADTSPDERQIFTSLPGAAPDLYGGTSFDAGNAALLKPYLGVKDNSAWDYLGAGHDDRVNNLIRFVRGYDTGFAGSTAIRTRAIGGRVWKLGDIVHSTPVSVSRPPDNYGLIYADESYQDFYDLYKDRETVIYVGANDGMLHAFTSWRYDRDAQQYVKPDGAPLLEEIGSEIWAYIPRALLPHLKWLADEDYTHVYYVDLKPKIADARIFFQADGVTPLDDDHPYGWGTVLIGGLNMGGKTISVSDDFDYNPATADSAVQFGSCYFAIDITVPRAPRFLWEKTYADMGFTTAFPAVLKVGGEWYAAFGSGPDDFDGGSAKPGHIFVVNLADGAPYRNGANDWLFETYENNAFMTGVVALDKSLNYNVDALYAGETYDDSPHGWKGALYKIAVPWHCTAGDCGDVAYGDTNNGEYSSDPNDAVHPWILARLLDESPGPVTAPPALSVDLFDNTWIYFGTGRYLSEDDKSDSSSQYLFGIKDPFFNYEHRPAGSFADDYYHNYSASLTLNTADLLDSDQYTVVENGLVWDGSQYISFAGLLDLAHAEDGWLKTLSTAKERVLNKPAVMGGLALFPTYIPSSEICGFGGASNLYALYYETGTANKKPVFTNGTALVGDKTVIKDSIDLGSGLASSVGIHVGRQEGAKAFVQQSTGVVKDIDLEPAFKIRSGLTSWKKN